MNQLNLEPSDPGPFVTIYAPRFTPRTYAESVLEQLEAGEEIGKFLQSEHQPILQDIEQRQLMRQKRGTC
ncbi:MAG: hypothetical protein EZS28_005574 [Streblomastix strix]|uniref:Uncharacterized protein n=1 Tax=Streblomastix strix TaxID=222440 RepID=A0A5J4WV24_9EUKA|nr:MAG: hypothetical protein EZS28_005574 [Streblomastix strix]